MPYLKNEQRRSPRRYDIAYPYSVPLRLKPMRLATIHYKDANNHITRASTVAEF